MDNTIGALPKVRFGDWISEGWNMFAEQWKVWVVNALVLALVTVVPLFGIYIFIVLIAASATGGGAEMGFVMMALMGLVVLFVGLAATYLMGGMYRCAFKQLRGEPISTGDIFSAGDCFLPLLGAMLLTSILYVIGLMLCVVPGLIVMGAMYFAAPLVVHGGHSSIDAMRLSRDATRGDLFMFVLFAFVVSLIAQAGSYACYVGMLATLPLMFTISAVAYRDVFGVAGARSFASKAAPQNAYGAPPLPPGYQQPGPPQWSGYAPPAQPPGPAQWSGYAPPAQSPGPYQAPPASPVTPSAIPPSMEPPYRQPPAPTQAPPESPASTVPAEPTPTAPTPARPTAEITCPACQAVLPSTARFCARCGQSLEARG